MSFDSKLLIQVHGNTAGGAAVLQRGALSAGMSVGKPGHVAGERPGVPEGQLGGEEKKKKRL